jgi:hypothetical protein
MANVVARGAATLTDEERVRYFHEYDDEIRDPHVREP